MASRAHAHAHAHAPAHAETLFHLVPANEVARGAIDHPDNKLFVSSSKDGRLGLEVGFHVSSIARGHVIARLGRNADLILRESTSEQPMSAIHAAFEINPETQHVLLVVRSKRISSVRFSVLKPETDAEDAENEPNVASEEPKDTEMEIIGDGVVLYGQDYEIKIASYDFNLLWRKISAASKNSDALKLLAIQGYNKSLERLQYVRSRDRPTEIVGSEALSWHMTRLDTAKRPLFQDIEHLRVHMGMGNFGTVFKAVDQAQGYTFAIKVVNLDKDDNVEASRALLHREVKVMERLKHSHIIEYLGCQRFDTLAPEIFMPLREGSLSSLVKAGPETTSDNLCLMVLEQMLSALDYLANDGLIHRDVKPDNILYYKEEDGSYHFQLADFGLTRHRSLATTFCGTGYYQAPELWPQVTGIRARQSPKMDVWSLFASIVAIHSKFAGFPPATANYAAVVGALEDAASSAPTLKPMARLHPDRRASAAQMLVLLFNSRGLTTAPSRIPPLDLLDAEEVPPSVQVPPYTAPRLPARASNPPKRDTRGKTPERPLIVYPPRPPRQRTTIPSPQPLRAQGGGVVKRRAEPRATRVNAPAMAHVLAKADAATKTNTAAEADTPSKANAPAESNAPAKPPLRKQDPRAAGGSRQALPRIPGAFVD
ncbi:Protein kinase-like domain protein [Niveomyces insectorum RCEF 264]|uniref:mitogen-activated protein kinase n=1 Tax=Niveomyces insectorum RCEF 264 TaxID=1081102 RepID=A0A167W4Z4_9HYPO|nr:Protein kinase-like domain protein [Niveomyces insectorum RCEF 264]